MELLGIAAVIWVCSSECRAWLGVFGPWVVRKVVGGQKWH